MNSNTKKRLSALEGANRSQAETRIIIRRIVSADGEPRRYKCKDGRIWDRAHGESREEFEARVIADAKIATTIAGAERTN